MNVPDGHRTGTRTPEEFNFPDKKWSNISGDMVFFAIFDQLQHFVHSKLGRSGRVCGEWVEVEHRWRRPWWNDETKEKIEADVIKFRGEREERDRKKQEGIEDKRKRDLENQKSRDKKRLERAERKKRNSS